MRTTASTRSLSHGFWTKSRAPRRIASTARSTVPQAVMTMTGIGDVELLQPRQERQALLARRRVARVVQIDQGDLEVARLDRRQHAGRRRRRLDVAALGFEQQAKRLQHVGLVVADENPRAIQHVGRYRRARRSGGLFGSHQSVASQPSFRRTIRLP